MPKPIDSLKDAHVVAAVFGRKNSRGVPGKNLWPILGRPLTVYPFLAAANAVSVKRVYVSTDDENIARIGESFGAFWLPRPEELANDRALLEDAIAGAYQQIRASENRPIDAVAILLSNAATVPTGAIDEAVRSLRADPGLDSVATVTRWNQYTPVRARVIQKNGLLGNYLPDDQVNKASCDRNTTGDIYFVDASLAVVRPRALENIHEGLPPFRWLGRKILPIAQRGGLDVDDAEGLVLTEYWLKHHGFSETTTPYDQKAAR
ncbi:MAG: cytidylyltransferase [Candidatus Omnitrophica bacterium]|nr:cytidylyltransferase [Candidatus Omnitrophota bacterium]